MKYESTEKFFNGHNMLLGDLPEQISLTDICQKIKFEKAEIEKFGLFGGNNFNKYYPELKAADLKPRKEDYVYSLFRALSETRVRPYFPVNFSKNGVLQRSSNKLLGQTVYPNHDAEVGNGLGTVYETSWQERQTVDGFLVPAGINTLLQLDGKKNPNIVRGVLAEPPEIHSTSVTVQFAWEQSHPQLTRDEFFRLAGTLDSNGDMIERIATEVIAYHEISLVSHGADPYAQQIKDGKIINPSYADTQKFSQDQKSTIYHFFDFKNLETETLSAESLHKAILNPPNNIEQNKKAQMDALTRLLESLGKKPESFKADDSAQVEALVAEIIKLKSDAAENATNLELVNTLKADKAALEPFKKVAEDALAASQAEALRLYNLTTDAPEVSMQELISKSDFAGSQVFITSFKKIIETNLGGGRSSKEEGEGGEGKEEFKVKSNAEVADSFRKSAPRSTKNIHG